MKKRPNIATNCHECGAALTESKYERAAGFQSYDPEKAWCKDCYEIMYVRAKYKNGHFEVRENKCEDERHDDVHNIDDYDFSSLSELRY